MVCSSDASLNDKTRFHRANRLQKSRPFLLRLTIQENVAGER